MVPFSGKEPGGPLGLSHSQSPGTTETLRYVSEKRSGPRVVIGKWLLKN
jgi:hypothetical protein